jgi:SAM-dependent methyltransferase
MDLKITPQVLAAFTDKDSKRPEYRVLYEQYPFLEAYARHTDARVALDPKWAIGRGDEWESHGALQLEFLKSEGLKPHHFLLDIGCGVGRAARRLVPYLEHAHYTGVDISAAALDHAQQLAVSEGWNEKCPTFLTNADLDLKNQMFDYLWAHSVFTHLPPQQVEKMIGNAASILRDGGRFLFSYKSAKKTQRSGLKQFQYSILDLARFAKQAKLRFEPLKTVWPAHQHTVRLTK